MRGQGLWCPLCKAGGEHGSAEPLHGGCGEAAGRAPSREGRGRRCRCLSQGSRQQILLGQEKRVVGRVERDSNVHSPVVRDSSRGSWLCSGSRGDAALGEAARGGWRWPGQPGGSGELGGVGRWWAWSPPDGARGARSLGRGARCVPKRLVRVSVGWEVSGPRPGASSAGCGGKGWVGAPCGVLATRLCRAGGFPAARWLPEPGVPLHISGISSYFGAFSTV